MQPDPQSREAAEADPRSATGADGERAPLLLHSLTNHREVILGALEAASVRTIAEVGSETGGFTEMLVRWAEPRGARVWTVEPDPAEEIQVLARTREHYTVVEGISPAALPQVPAADAWVLDGDHNYWTVAAELAEIGSRPPEGRSHALVVLHDVGWPCARRDQYYAPSALPSEGLHPYTYSGGVVPDVPGMVDGGFRGEGEFAYAEHEGGPANGVLTAVEDYLATRDDLLYRHVPSVFGLGVVFPADAPYAPALREMLDPLHEQPALQRLERNRLELYLRVLELQDALGAQHAARDRQLVALFERVDALEAENVALRSERLRLAARVG
jgi:hypothetical protein